MSLQEQIIQELHVKETINPQYEIRRTVNFLKEYLYQHPFLKTYVLGISGGQDSTLAGRLTQLAIEEIREETADDSYRFIAVRLPYGEQLDEVDAKKALTFIRADEEYTINIKKPTDEMVNEVVAQGIEVTDFNKGNIKARQRMIAQYTIAGARSGAVVGTDHAGEAVTGFYTKYGDGAADIMPLWRLTKGQGRELLKELNCPAELYLKTPVADLEDNKPLEADEVSLGVSYQEIDDYLTGKKIATKARQRIEELYLKSKHKRNMPINIYDQFWR